MMYLKIERLYLHCNDVSRTNLEFLSRFDKEEYYFEYEGIWQHYI